MVAQEGGEVNDRNKCPKCEQILGSTEEKYRLYNERDRLNSDLKAEQKLSADRLVAFDLVHTELKKKEEKIGIDEDAMVIMQGRIDELNMKLKKKDEQINKMESDLNVMAKALGTIYADVLYNTVKDIIKPKDEKVK
jgi:CII-binding regulator of phage lambda lysogenization HflD